MENKTIRAKQRGAAMIEMSLTLMIFLLLVFAILDFSLLMMNVARANEVTRELSRIAIVSSPVCDFYEGTCPGAVPVLTCPGGAPVRLTLAELGEDCAAAGETTSCRMLERATAFIPEIEASQIAITYACSTAGAADRPKVVPLVSVGLQDLQYGMVLPALLGLEGGPVTIPSFATVRTGEALYTLRTQ